MKSTTDLKRLSLRKWSDEHDHKSTYYTLIESDAYRFDIEETPLSPQDMAYLVHIEVYKWSPSALKDMLVQWKWIRPQINGPIMACSELQDKKWSKFVGKFGFRPLCPVVGTDGTTKQMYVNLNN